MSLIATALTTLTEAKAYLKIDHAAALQVFAEYVGMGDGETKVFTLDNTPIDGSLKLYLDGTLQTETTHYSISTATVTFVTAPGNNKPVTASYDYAAGDNTFESYDDSLLEEAINAATKIVEDYCGRAFITRTVTENRIGNGDKLIRLNKMPIDSITSVTLDGTELTVDTDYDDNLLTMGWLKRASKWTKDKTLVVVYDAGDCADLDAVRSDYPQAILATLLIMADLYENRGDRVAVESITGTSSTTYNMPSKAKTILFSINPTGGFA